MFSLCLPAFGFLDFLVFFLRAMQVRLLGVNESVLVCLSMSTL